MAQQVTVTGGSGFVAGWLIQQLLEKGYKVNATVRSTADGNPKIQHLLRLGSAFAGSLQLFEADLQTPGAFDAPVKGSVYVFHVASPVLFDVKDPQKEIIDPAVQGTENLLASVAKYRDTVKRVVITSSIAAVHGTQAWLSGKQVPKNGQLFTEEDYNTYSSVNDEPYSASKYQAEQAAEAWSEREGIRVVHINIGMVVGPVLSAEAANSSPSLMLTMFTDTASPAFAGIPAWVDVRDSARAHILAAELPHAKGRYIVGTQSGYNSLWISKVLKARFPQYKFADGEATHMPVAMDNSKVQRELGLTLRPVEESIIDLATSLIAVGKAKPELL